MKRQKYKNKRNTLLNYGLNFNQTEEKFVDYSKFEISKIVYNIISETTYLEMIHHPNA